MGEDAGDDCRVGDDGHGAHQGGTPGAGEGLDFEDAPEQLRPSAARGPQESVHGLADRDGVLDQPLGSRAVGRLASATRFCTSRCVSLLAAPALGPCATSSRYRRSGRARIGTRFIRRST